MGLLDMIIGWFLFTQLWSLLSTIPRRGVFFSQTRGLLCYLPRTGIFSFLRILVQKGNVLSKQMMSGPDSLKKYDIWSDVIILDLL